MLLLLQRGNICNDVTAKTLTNYSYNIIRACKCNNDHNVACVLLVKLRTLLYHAASNVVLLASLVLSICMCFDEKVALNGFFRCFMQNLLSLIVVSEAVVDLRVREGGLYSYRKYLTPYTRMCSILLWSL